MVSAAAKVFVKEDDTVMYREALAPKLQVKIDKNSKTLLPLPWLFEIIELCMHRQNWRKKTVPSRAYRHQPSANIVRLSKLDQSRDSGPWSNSVQLGDKHRNLRKPLMFHYPSGFGSYLDFLNKIHFPNWQQGSFLSWSMFLLFVCLSHSKSFKCQACLSYLKFLSPLPELCTQLALQTLSHDVKGH